MRVEIGYQIILRIPWYVRLELGKKEGVIRDDLDIDILSNVINALHNGILFEWHMNYDEINSVLLARTY